MDAVTRAVIQNKKKKHLPVGECFFLSIGCLVSSVSGYSAFPVLRTKAGQDQGAVLGRRWFRFAV